MVIMVLRHEPRPSLKRCLMCLSKVDYFGLVYLEIDVTSSFTHTSKTSIKRFMSLGLFNFINCFLRKELFLRVSTGCVWCPIGLYGPMRHMSYQRDM